MSESRTTSLRRIEFTVDWPPGHVACYLVDGPELVVVDAGMPADFAADEATPEATFREGLDAAGYEVADVDHLVLTHPHVDHVGQVPTVLAEADPTVYAPAGVRERFSRDPDALGERIRANARRAGITGDQLDEAVEMAVESLERDASLLPTDAVDVWVAGGDAVEIGPLEAEAVHAPGHQADHLCYAVDVEGERALLSGDMVMEPFRAVALHDGLDDGVSEAVSAFYAALDRLSALDPDRVYPGHGPVHADFRDVLERDRASLDRRLDQVREQFASGTRTVVGVALALSGDRSVHYVVPEAMAAAEHLVEEGRAERTVEDGVAYYEPA